MPALAVGQQAPPAPPAAPTEPPPLAVTVTVVGTTPLPGIGVTLDKIPAPVQTATSLDLEVSGALDLSSFMNARLAGVHINEMQGNPYQPDLNYRGYTASPLLGTPQGVSVFMDGVRMNQPFGDVVSWDLIPRAAITSMAMMPGSNPVFGLNTLGGALAIETKSGRTDPGTSVRVFGGRDARRAVEVEHGGSRSNGFNWYLTGNLFAENGWRQESPSDVRQVFGKVGWLREKGELTVSVSHANNLLNGNGLQEFRLLQADRTSIYTLSDNTSNRSTGVTATLRRELRPQLTFSGNVYARHLRTTTYNGDINEGSLDQSVYQPTPVEQAALAAAGYTGVPTSGANASNTPFPYWRCIANVLLQDEPGEKCNGLLNRTGTQQTNGGLSAQLTRFSGTDGGRNQFTVGGGVDASGIDFTQTSELGYLNPDRSLTGMGVFADGVHAGTVDGEPFDLAVDLHGRVQTASVYATDTLALARGWHLTLSGRYNRTTIENRDRLHPGGGTGSLDGNESFGRFNPAAGVTVGLTRTMSAYGGYSEGSRAPTSIELGCADPAAPCRLPNAMAGDPPLDQVVTRTLEAGLRGQKAALTWSAGWFRARNSNDILFVMSDQTGFGYFTNFGETRRQGVDVTAQYHRGRVTMGGGYTWLDATYQSEESVNGSGNSQNDAGAGLGGAITIEPGDRMPLIPRHLGKVFADLALTHALSVDLDVLAVSSSLARGNENNAHQPDGVYYLASGQADGYVVVNLGVRYQLRARIQLFAQVNNLFNVDYVTASQLGVTGFTAAGDFIARPFPPVNGQFPLQGSTFFAPGAPITAWGGVRVKF
jgi:outer membrane receptor protein involved in Fe transport